MHQPVQRVEQLGLLNIPAEVLHLVTVLMSDCGISASYHRDGSMRVDGFLRDCPPAHSEA